MPSCSSVGITSFSGFRHQRVFVLKRGDALDRVSATNGLRTRFGQAKVLHLAFAYEFLDGAGHVFDRHVRIYAVLIEQIDGVDLEAREGSLGHLSDVLGPTIQILLLVAGSETRTWLRSRPAP